MKHRETQKSVKSARKGNLSLLLMVLVAVLGLPCRALAIESAEDIMNRASAKIKSAKSIVANFTFSGQGTTAKGTLKSKGSKFALVSDATSSWYNGKDLYQYSPATAETTLTSPESKELMDVNPLLYLAAAGAFKPTLSKSQPSGRKALVLIPKTKSSGLKNVALQLDAKTLLPLKIVVTSAGGESLTVNISKIILNSPVSDSDFVYPKSKYKHIKVVDLR